MGVMLFPSLWLGNASERGGGGGGCACFAPHSLLSFRLPPPLLYLSSSLFFPSFFLAPLLSHLLFLLSLSSVPIFFSSSPPSCLLFIMSFSFVSLPPLLPSPSFSSFEINHFLFHPHLFLLLFLGELLVLCVLRELLILYALRESLVCFL